jgi:hypothetical protein
MESMKILLRHPQDGACQQSVQPAPPAPPPVPLQSPEEQADLFREWKVDGTEIQLFVPSIRAGWGTWKDVTQPSWSPLRRYRRKQYPDVVQDFFVRLDTHQGTPLRGIKYNADTEPNLRITFNGYTGRVRKVEVLS